MMIITQVSRAKFEACLWEGLQRRLSAWNPKWRDGIGGPAVEERIARRRRGDRFSDSEVFEGLLLAVLSGNTQWSTVERIRSELTEPFEAFSLAAYARKSDAEAQALAAWFSERKAGSTGLEAGLVRLRNAAGLLDRYSQTHGGADAFFRDALMATGGDAEDLAVALGSSKAWKLPGFGIALAAEALRNIGFDLCKPDRHVLRAVGAWGLVEFHKWPKLSAFTAPSASPAELHRTMCAVRAFAQTNGVGVSYATSVIWISGALSGARLSNQDLHAIATACNSVDTDRTGR